MPTQTAVLIVKTVFTIHPITPAVSQRLKTSCLVRAEPNEPFIGPLV